MRFRHISAKMQPKNLKQTCSLLVLNSAWQRFDWRDGPLGLPGYALGYMYLRLFSGAEL